MIETDFGNLMCQDCHQCNITIHDLRDEDYKCSCCGAIYTLKKIK